MKLMFAQGPALGARVIFAVILSVALMVLDHRFHRLEQMRSWLSVIAHPVNLIAGLPAELASGSQGLLEDKEQLRAENEFLHQENLKLKAEMQKYQALLSENERLRDLLGSSFKVSDRVLVAEVSTVSLDPFRQQVLLKRGSTAGVYEGQAVLDAQAVMGQVTHVTPFTSTVLLITDVNAALPVKVLRNSLRTIAVGTGQSNRLELPYLPNNTDIQAGDLLVTSGLGHKYPENYPVAVVKEIAVKPGKPFAHIIAEPLAKLDRASEAMLVWELNTEAERAAEDQANEGRN